MLSTESLADSKHSIGASQVAQRKRIPESGIASRIGNGQPTPSILAWKNPIDRGAWQAIVHGVTKSPT